MNNNTNEIIKMSFWQLITKYNIEIPIIQRDYTQGRGDKKTETIRKKFLEDLVKAITDNKPIELDFIYGSVKDNTLQPLDGQQRLTTLFLLHWYIAKKIDKPEAKEILLKFTYETRITSREFCKALVDNIDNLGQGKSIVEQIKDASWFFLSWRKDPTIKAMLVMLNAIEEKLRSPHDKKMDEIWNSLTDDNAPITFHFIPLEKFGLSDDLYIKMNARGKELTPFEIFKARFEKHIENNKWEENISPENHTDTFAHKADTVLTDLFWEHRDNENNNIDDAFIKFIAGIAINLHSLSLNPKEKKNQNEKKDPREEIIQKLHKDPSSVDPNKDFSDKKAFEYLTTRLDMYSDKEKCYDKMELKLTIWDCDEKTLFEVFAKPGTTYRQRALFYAQTEYLIRNKYQQKIDTEQFFHWMRVIRNIVTNPNIDGVVDFISAVGLIQELAKSCNDIYEYLSRPNLSIKSGFAKAQVEEEMLKAKIIQISPENKQVVFDTEDTNFCRGQITFALYCIGIDTASDPKEFRSEELSKIKRVIETYLNRDDIDNEFRRALLVIMKDHVFQEDTTTFRHNYRGKILYQALGYVTYCLIEDVKDLRYKIKPKTRKDSQIYFEYFGNLLKALTKQTPDVIIKDFNKNPKGIDDWRRILIKKGFPKDENYWHPYYFGIPWDEKKQKDCFLYLHGKMRPRSKEGMVFSVKDWKVVE